MNLNVPKRRFLANYVGSFQMSKLLLSVPNRLCPLSIRQLGLNVGSNPL